MGVADGWVEIGDRVFVRRYAFYDQNIGVVLGRGEALVIDTRSSYRQAREILADLRTLTTRPGHGRRRHARALRSRLRQRGLPARDDLGPRRLRPVHGTDRRGAQGEDRGRDAGACRLNSTRSSSIRPTGRSTRQRDASRWAAARSTLRYLGRGHTDHDIVISVPGTDVLFAGDLLENGAVPFVRRRIPDRLGATAARLAPLVDAERGVVVPGHGDHAGRAFADSQAASIAEVAALARAGRSRRADIGRRDRRPSLPGASTRRRPRGPDSCRGPAARRGCAPVSEVLWDARLLDLEAGVASERRTITIDGGVVTAIGDAGGSAPAGARDLGGATVLPGLIDAHCHVLSDTDRSPGFGPPPLLHGEAPRPAAAASANELLSAGGRGPVHRSMRFARPRSGWAAALGRPDIRARRCRGAGGSRHRRRLGRTRTSRS